MCQVAALHRPPRGACWILHGEHHDAVQSSSLQAPRMPVGQQV